MPSVLAHYQFGQEVLKELSERTLQLVKSYKEEFDLGLQGPDILFFYKPYTGTYISKIGSEIHSHSGKLFFERGYRIYREAKNAPFLAYVSGCLCHYWLDKNVHPFVNEKTPKIADHYRIESEFDSLIAQKYRLSGVKKEYLPNFTTEISEFGELYGISVKNFNLSVKDMRRYVGLLQHREPVAFLEKLILRKTFFSNMSPQKNFIYEKETAEMHNLFKNCIGSCAKSIDMLFSWFVEKQDEPDIFTENFEGV